MTIRAIITDDRGIMSAWALVNDVVRIELRIKGNSYSATWKAPKNKTANAKIYTIAIYARDTKSQEAVPVIAGLVTVQGKSRKRQDVLALASKVSAKSYPNNKIQTATSMVDKAGTRSNESSGSPQLKTTASNRNLPLTQRKGAVATAARQSISSQSQSRQSHLMTIQSMVSLSTFVLPHYSAELDFDQDGLTDEEELEMLSNPAEADTDGDGLTDGEEFYLSLTDLLSSDTDGDGWEDGEEIFLTETNPSIKDDSLATHPKQGSGKRPSH